MKKLPSSHFRKSGTYLKLEGMKNNYLQLVLNESTSGIPGLKAQRQGVAASSRPHWAVPGVKSQAGMYKQDPVSNI